MSEVLTKKRMTNSELNHLRSEIISLCKNHQPLSVRQLFYLLVTRGYIEKTEKAYKQVIRLSGELRTSGELPFRWIRDDSRRRMGMSLHKSAADALRDASEHFAYDFQIMQPIRLEVWCEKETLSGVLWPTCAKYRIDLLPCKGMPSLTYRHEAAMAANLDGRPFNVIYVGDSDPTGEMIDPTINRFMDEYLKVEWLGIERIAVTDEQRTAMSLPTRPPKETGARAGRHAEIGCVEVEAIPPDALRRILAKSLEANLDMDALRRAHLEDDAQRETLEAMIASLGGCEPDESQKVHEVEPSREIILYEWISETEAQPMERSNPLYKEFWSKGYGKSDWLHELGKDVCVRLGHNRNEPAIKACVIDLNPTCIVLSRWPERR